MQAAKVQNILILSLILGFALMEWTTRRYRNSANATANDTKLELFMFLSLLGITQPLALLVTSKLGHALFPAYQGVLAEAVVILSPLNPEMGIAVNSAMPMLCAKAA